MNKEANNKFDKKAHFKKLGLKYKYISSQT